MHPAARDHPMNVVVLGLWHLGCVTAACCAEHFSVVGVDFDEATVISLREGKAPISEPGLDELIVRGLASHRLAFALGADAAVLGAADVLWVCYDTPVDDNDVADVAFVLDKIAACLPALRPSATVLISSQIPAGTLPRTGKTASRHPLCLQPGKSATGQGARHLPPPGTYRCRGPRRLRPRRAGTPLRAVL